MKRSAESSDFGSENKFTKASKVDDSLKKSSLVLTALNVDSVASKRVVEIQALTDLVNNIGGNHQAFQKLPPHMRRRAMSHNIKRVPRRLHDLVKSELDKVKAQNKRPSRKYRRKPSNLLSEYEQRKRRIRWLDTHIWHAKRFKMSEAWGYKLPYHPSSKSIRSCYRSVQRHCLMQDVSYETYIEIKGKMTDIISGLSHLVSEETGPTFAARATKTGMKEGSLYIYSYDCYPKGVLGRVSYLWHAESNTENIGDLLSTLWICCHPSFETEALKEINKCFGYSSTESNTSSKACESNLTNIRSIEGMGKDISVSVSSLKHEMVKFRLFGPASNLVLQECLEFWNTDELNLPENGTPSSVCQEKEHFQGSAWWKSYYQRNERQVEIEKQKAALSAVMGCRSPAEAPPNLIVGATVRDPRLKLPPKRNKVSVYEAETTEESLRSEMFTPEVSISPLWCKEVRENVKASKISEKDLNDMRSKHLIPGTKLELGEKESRIPIILIQRPGLTGLNSSTSSTQCSGQQQIGYASGWDLLLPAGWAMAFWVALVYRGARVGGQREAKSISLQARQLVGIRDVPDSTAGKKELELEAVELQTKHDKRPPAKRPNYIKLGFDFPFVFPFEQLCRDWSKKLANITDGLTMKEEPLHVLRHRLTLRMLNTALTSPVNFLKSLIDAKSNSSWILKSNSNIIEKLLSTDKGKDLIQKHSLAMLPIVLTMRHRGVPSAHAHICIPSVEDLKKIKKMKNYGGPEEKLHPDKDAPKRKAERKERLRLQKKKSKKVDKSKDRSKGDKIEQEKKIVMEETELKENAVKLDTDDCANMIDKPSRDIVGFVTIGDFDLGQGQGTGIGFCSISGLLHLIEAQQRGGNEKGVCMALVRNPTSLQYRFASISVLL